MSVDNEGVFSNSTLQIPVFHKYLLKDIVDFLSVSESEAYEFNRIPHCNAVLHTKETFQLLYKYNQKIEINTRRLVTGY